jgi:hypothetical protein
MPWRHTSPMDPKTPFIAAYLRDRLAVTELCELYGISRKTRYTRIDRDLIQNSVAGTPRLFPHGSCLETHTVYGDDKSDRR